MTETGKFSAEEREAMKDRAQELKKSRRPRAKKDDEADQLAKIAEMSDGDRTLAEKVRAIVKESAPELTPKLYYGMPAWAKDGKVLCFFQPADKWKTRYATLGFNDNANLDDGDMFPTAFGLHKLTAADEKRLADIIKQAAS